MYRLSFLKIHYHFIQQQKTIVSHEGAHLNIALHYVDRGLWNQIISRAYEGAMNA